MTVPRTSETAQERGEAVPVDAPAGVAAATARVGRARARFDVAWALVAFAVCIVAATWWLVFAQQREAERQEVAAVSRENANLARAFAEHTCRVLKSVDHMASLARAEYERRGARFDLDAFARDAAFVSNGVLGMLVVDEHGEPVLSTSGMPGIPPTAIGSFRGHVASASREGHVGRAFAGPQGGQWMLPVSYRIDRPDGRFGGALVVALDALAFAEFYRSIDLGRDGVVTLLGNDGFVRAALAPRGEPMGQAVHAVHPFLAGVSEERGAVVAPGGLDGVRRIHSFQALDMHAMTIVVASSEDESLASLRRSWGWTLAWTASSTGVVAVFIGWVVTLLRRQRAAALALEVGERQQRALLDSIADAAWFKDAEGRFIEVNQAHRAVFGVAPEVLIGRTNDEAGCDSVSDIVARDLEDRRVLATGETLRGEYEIRRDGELRWVETIKVPIVDPHGVAWGIAATARDVTERKRMEQALAASEERLRRALRHANLGMWDWDLASDEMLQSERMPALLGWPAEPPGVTRARFLARIHPEDRARVEEATRACLHEGAEYAVEYRVVRPDGTLRWLDDRGDVIRGVDGVPQRMFGILQDVTQRRLAEDEVRASESHFRTIFERSALGMIIVTPDGRRVRANAAFSRMLGYGEDELREMTEARYTHPDDREPTQAHMREALAGGATSFQLEKRYLHRSGRLLWGLLNATLVRDPAGAPVHFVGQIVDITARKTAELALTEAQARFRVFVENMQEVFWIATPGIDRVQYLSPAFETVFGLSAEVFHRDPVVWRSLIHPDDRAVVDRFLRDQKARRRAECEIRIVRPDGGLRWVFARSIPWEGADGTALAAGVADDVTSRKLQHEERVRAAEAQRDTLVMEVHHRIKNNLQGVVGLLRRYSRANADVREALDGIAAQIQSIAFVHGLQGEASGASVDVEPLVRLVASALEPLGRSPVVFEAAVPAAGPLHLKERESVPVALILNELVWNAIKHSAPGEPVRIGVTADPVDGGVRIEIKNAGQVRSDWLDEARRSGTSGLGLVQALMPRQGASLQFDARAGYVRTVLTLGASVLARSPQRPAAAAESAVAEPTVVQATVTEHAGPQVRRENEEMNVG